MKKLDLLGMKTWTHGISVRMYFPNGEVKDCYEEDLGFKINEDLSTPVVIIHGYRDNRVYDELKQEFVVQGKNEKEIESCTVEGNKQCIDEYLYKLGIFNEYIPVNRNLIEDRLSSNLESSISNLSSNISFLENTLSRNC